MAVERFLNRARRIAGVAYERLLAPLGVRAVEQMLGDGLPDRLAPALRFLFRRRAPEPAEGAARRIEHLRARIAARPNVYRFAHFGTSLGPARVAERVDDAEGGLTSNQLATAFSVPRRWGIFLHLCAEAFEARVVLEMGACVGISGAYLASIPSRPHLVTLEGSQSLAQIAQETVAAVSDRAEVILGPFEQKLMATLERLAETHQTIDVAFVDGHHEEAATQHYVAAISAQLSPTALIILDDIYLYEGMWRAWQNLSSSANVIAVNVGRFGLLMYGGRATGLQYDLSRYTGRWRVGGTRARAIAKGNAP